LHRGRRDVFDRRRLQWLALQQVRRPGRSVLPERSLFAGQLLRKQPDVRRRSGLLMGYPG
jgi:hypothetical protein